MESFTVKLNINELSIGLIVTTIDARPFYFKIETTTGGPNSMTINRLPDHSWNAECIDMEYFTHEHVQRLGALIEKEKPAVFSKKWVRNNSPLNKAKRPL